MMPNITKETKKGRLTKIKGKWYVNCLRIHELENESERIADLKLVEKFNKSVIELENLEVNWRYIVTDSATNFGHEYATLL